MGDTPLNVFEFRDLIDRLAEAWADCDAVAAAACFTPDAVYMEPPDRQLFRGRTELQSYFSPLADGTYLDFHGLWFDPDSQVGSIEFGFGVAGSQSADYGVAVVEVGDGVITTWREYHRPGPVPFDRFVSTEDKAWDWHAGNYP